MSATGTSVFNTLSMADSCILSLPSILGAKSSSPIFSIPARPVKLNLSCAYSTSFSQSLPLRKKTNFPSIVTFVAQTEEDNTVTLEQEEGAEAQVSEDEAEAGESSGEGSLEEAEEESYEEPPEDAKIFVANLSYDVDSERLAMLFEECGVVEIAEVIYNRETDRSRGFGFVTFSTVEEAEKAVEKMNGYELNGRTLTVNKAARRGERVERPPRAPESAFRIYVGNIPWDVDSSRLEQIFSEHGKVEDARVVYDRETGRSRGFGFVAMSDETEMNDAIAALDGQSIDGRAIRVNVAEQRPRRF